MAGLASTSAYAADAVFEEPPAPVAVIEVPIFVWTGGYLGPQGGGLWSDSDIDDPDTGVFSDNFNGGLFGAYAGYNWQSGAWVFGVEGDINGVWNDETVSIGPFDVDVGSDYLASLRGRVRTRVRPRAYFRHRRRSLYRRVPAQLTPLVALAWMRMTV